MAREHEEAQGLERHSCFLYWVRYCILQAIRQYTITVLLCVLCLKGFRKVRCCDQKRPCLVSSSVPLPKVLRGSALVFRAVRIVKVLVLSPILRRYWQPHPTLPYYRREKRPLRATEYKCARATRDALSISFPCPCPRPWRDKRRVITRRVPKDRRQYTSYLSLNATALTVFNGSSGSRAVGQQSAPKAYASILLQPHFEV